MALGRRQFLAAALAAARAHSQGRAVEAAPPRAVPLVCLYSQALIEIDYIELPQIVRGLGFDGCNLTVKPGGHVNPKAADVSLMPALEAMSGADLEVPIITTALTSMADPTAGEVLGLAGVIGVPFFRPGPWRFNAPSPALQHEIAGLGAVGRASKLAMGIPNTGEAAGGTVANVSRIVRPLDPRWVGFDFDPLPAVVDGGADAVAAAFAMALPRLKMVTVRDCKKDATPCPLGEGVVDWRHFFGLLARAKFTGPITLQVDYKAQDKLAAIRRDGEFLRKCMGVGYGVG